MLSDEAVLWDEEAASPEPAVLCEELDVLPAVLWEELDVPFEDELEELSEEEVLSALEEDDVVPEEAPEEDALDEVLLEELEELEVLLEELDEGVLATPLTVTSSPLLVTVHPL